MPKIHVLDKQTAELIAAGEVVERPASAVKELIENAIDAGATQITVKLERGGVSLISVTDNGCGIARSDVPTAFLRHATSKISNESDLERIGTLGFRGEALAAICAVSKVTMITRRAEDEIGTIYTIEGGEEQLCDDVGCAVGTTIEVHDLFYNTPARMKFLKKDVKEGANVSAVVDRIALSHPEVAFKMIKDGKQTLSTQGNGNLRDAVYAVLGRDIALGTIPISYEGGGVKVSGLICKPFKCRPNRNLQLVYLNGRFVKSATVMAALDVGYKNSAMVGKFPYCVLNVEVPFETVDVNVHPAKTEVRFADESRVFDAVRYGVRNALAADTSRPQFEQKGAHIKAKSQEFLNAVFKDGGESLGETVKLPVRADGAKLNDTAAYKTVEDAVVGGRANDIQQSTADKSTEGSEAFGSGEFKVTVANPENYDIAAAKRQDGEFESFNAFTGSGVRESVERGPLNSVNIDVEVELPDNDNTSKPSVAEPLSTETERQESKDKYNKAQYTENDGDIAFHKEQAGFQKAAEETPNDEPTARFIGELFKTYILAEQDGKLLLIDKHAAHERILFEQQKSKAVSESQYLLSAATITLEKREYAAITENTELLKKAGFEIEDFGDGTVMVRAVPSMLENDDLESLLSEIADSLLKTGDVSVEKLDRIYHTVACKAAVKAGWVSSEPQLKELMNRALLDPKIRYCPHGRPITVEITRAQLERMFGRA